MRMRLWTLVLMLGLALPAMGCPGGDGDSDGGTAGAAGADGAGSGGDDGASSGASGASGTSGTGGGGTSTVTPEQAASGACAMMGSGGATGLPECADLDAYNSCVLDDCGLNACFANQCADYISCIQNAADPCDSGCTQSAECTSCITVNQACLASCVTTHILCSDGSGASCDELDACCATLPAEMMAQCAEAASLGRASGQDIVCSGALMSFCP